MCMELYCSPESAGQFGPSADPAASVTRTSRVINCIGIVHEEFWLDVFPRILLPLLLEWNPPKSEHVPVHRVMVYFMLKVSTSN